MHDPSNGKAFPFSKVDFLLPGFDPSHKGFADVCLAIISSNTHVCEEQMRLRDVHIHITENSSKAKLREKKATNLK